jgi:hypothetical protein
MAFKGKVEKRNPLTRGRGARGKQENPNKRKAAIPRSKIMEVRAKRCARLKLKAKPSHSSASRPARM